MFDKPKLPNAIRPLESAGIDYTGVSQAFKFREEWSIQPEQQSGLHI